MTGRLLACLHHRAWLPTWAAALLVSVGVVASWKVTVIGTAGILLGYAAHRLGWNEHHLWSAALRIVTYGIAAVITFLAMWGFSPSTDLAVAFTVQAGIWAAVAVALRRNRDDPGRGSLYGWAGKTNVGPWLTATSTAFGSDATQAAVTADAASFPVIAFSIRLMRKHAPAPQKQATRYVDYAVPTAVVLGLLTHQIVDRPHAVGSALVVLASIGGALGWASMVGSLLRDDQRNMTVTTSDLGEWARITVARIGAIAIFGTIFAAAGFIPSAYYPLLIIAAFTAPTITPVSLAVLYGYKSPTVVWLALRLGPVLACTGIAILFLGPWFTV